MNKKIFIDNENKWVATDLEYKTLFASSKTLRVLQKKLKKLQVKDALTFFVPPFNKSLVP